MKITFITKNGWEWYNVIASSLSCRSRISHLILLIGRREKGKDLLLEFENHLFVPFVSQVGNQIGEAN